jgi:hypothetical protein
MLYEITFRTVTDRELNDGTDRKADAPSSGDAFSGSCQRQAIKSS